jgi:hypothetical protein
MLKEFLELWYVWLLLILCLIYYVKKPIIKGFLGEKAISIILSRLDSKKYRVINDLMIEVEGKTSQIDHVIISNYGIFVIETKNYKGWIIGDEYSEYWTQVIYKRKEKLYNPIRQNYGHVQALKNYLSDYPDLKYIPNDVFSVTADLKVKTKSDVVYSLKLLKTIKQYDEENITDPDKEKIQSRLLELNIKQKETRKKHVEDIILMKEEKMVRIESDTCPKCGGSLVIRNGKYGKFKGCSNYPKCKFVHKE